MAHRYVEQGSEPFGGAHAALRPKQQVDAADIRAATKQGLDEHAAQEPGATREEDASA